MTNVLTSRDRCPLQEPEQEPDYGEHMRGSLIPEYVMPYQSEHGTAASPPYSNNTMTGTEFGSSVLSEYQSIGGVVSNKKPAIMPRDLFFSYHREFCTDMEQSDEFHPLERSIATAIVQIVKTFDHWLLVTQFSN